MNGVESPTSIMTAAIDACDHLRQQIGFEQWIVTRFRNGQMTVLHAHGTITGPTEGSALAWDTPRWDALTVRDGAQIAPDTTTPPPYVQIPLAPHFAVRAYASVPLLSTDETLLGTLNAIAPNRQPPKVTDEAPTLAFVGRMLARVLESEIGYAEQGQIAQQALNDALSDSLTGLYNRRGWERRLTEEASRAHRHKSPICVLAVDIDGLKTINDTRGHAAGDAVLCRAANTMRAALRDQDVLARVGGDEFLVLGVACEPTGLDGLLHRVTQALAQASVPASIGKAQHRPDEPLAATVERADSAMYAQKRARTADRSF